MTGLRRLDEARHATTTGKAVADVDGDEIVAARRARHARRYFERGGADESERAARRSPRRAAASAPIVPKKFFHTAGNFREHEDESKTRRLVRTRSRPSIMFFQNTDAIIGPDALSSTPAP